MNQDPHPDFDEVSADEQPAPATTAPNSRTEGERWIEAYRRDAVAWMLQTISEAAVEGAEAEPDTPLWPDPGTPERARLDRCNAAICAGLRDGFQRHRAASAGVAGPKAGGGLKR
jgi:hypothetical protein